MALSEHASINVLNFAGPVSGRRPAVTGGTQIAARVTQLVTDLFSMPPHGATMTSPDADRLSDVAQPSPQEKSREEPSAIQPQADSASATSAEQDRLSVQAALRGDQSAFADLVSRYQSAVYNMAYRMLGDPTEAEDAAQEVFVRAWNQLHTFQLDRRFSTWLLSIASHYCIDLLRRTRPSAPLDDVALYVESDDPQPDDLALQSEQSDTIKRLLKTLPDKYRSVTVLRYYNDLSYEEIARITGLSESAVKTQLHRARRMLAEKILGKGGAPDGMPADL
jgi:RNA polymerase sigma-70 factor (ECF subfamily)